MINISTRYFPTLILVFACFIRLVYFYQFQGNPFSDHLPSLWDQTLYHKGAQAFINGDLYALAPGEPNQQSPFYQYFLGLIYFFFGTELTSAWVVQLILGVVSSFLVYAISQRYMSQGYSFMAAIMFIFYGGNWFYECTLYRASLVTLLSLSVCLLLLRFAQKPSIGLLIASALSLSFLTQTRSNLIIFIPIALIYLWKKVFSLSGTGKKWLAGYLLIFFIASLPLLIWVKQIHGHWGLYDQTGGENLYLANSPDYPVRSVVHDKAYRSLLQSERLSTLPALKLILKDITERPFDVIKIYFKKIYYYFNNYEVPTTHNYYLSSELSPVLKWASIPFGVIATLGIIGFFWSWINWKKLTLLHAFFLGNLVAYLPFFIFSRYRLSIVPFLCIFSAFSLQLIYQRFRHNDLRLLSLVILLAVTLGWFVKTSTLPEGKIRILDYINISSAYLNNNNPDDDNLSYNYLKRSWELSRSLPADIRQPKIIRKALGHFYFKQADFFKREGDFVREDLTIQKAIAFDFRSSSLHARYARHLIKKGEPKKALLESLIALTINPNSFDLNLLAGKIYIMDPPQPLWAVYHLILAHTFSNQPVPLSLTNSIQSLQDVLKLDSVTFDLQKLTTQARNILSSEISSLNNFQMKATLPANASNWTSQELYTYQIRLHQNLLFNPNVNTALIYYQLGTLEWQFLKNDNSSFYYFEKAWDHGFKNQKIAYLLNKLSEELSTRNIFK
jgi:hypothetical protein